MTAGARNRVQRGEALVAIVHALPQKLDPFSCILLRYLHAREKAVAAEEGGGWTSSFGELSGTQRCWNRARTYIAKWSKV